MHNKPPDEPSRLQLSGRRLERLNIWSDTNVV